MQGFLSEVCAALPCFWQHCQHALLYRMADYTSPLVALVCKGQTSSFLSLLSAGCLSKIIGRLFLGLPLNIALCIILAWSTFLFETSQILIINLHLLLPLSYLSK